MLAHGLQIILYTYIYTYVSEPCLLWHCGVGLWWRGPAPLLAGLWVDPETGSHWLVDGDQASSWQVIEDLLYM